MSSSVSAQREWWRSSKEVSGMVQDWWWQKSKVQVWRHDSVRCGRWVAERVHNEITVRQGFNENNTLQIDTRAGHSIVTATIWRRLHFLCSGSWLTDESEVVRWKPGATTRDTHTDTHTDKIETQGEGKRQENTGGEQPPHEKQP